MAPQPGTCSKAAIPQVMFQAASDLDKREQDLNQTLAEIPAHCEEQFSINSASFNSCVDAKSREARSELLDYKLLLERAKQPNDTDAKVCIVTMKAQKIMKL